MPTSVYSHSFAWLVGIHSTSDGLGLSGLPVAEVEEDSPVFSAGVATPRSNRRAESSTDAIERQIPGGNGLMLSASIHSCTHVDHSQDHFAMAVQIFPNQQSLRKRMRATQ